MTTGLSSLRKASIHQEGLCLSFEADVCNMKYNFQEIHIDLFHSPVKLNSRARLAEQHLTRGAIWTSPGQSHQASSTGMSPHTPSCRWNGAPEPSSRASPSTRPTSCVLKSA